VGSARFQGDRRVREPAHRFQRRLPCIPWGHSPCVWVLVVSWPIRGATLDPSLPQAVCINPYTRLSDARRPCSRASLGGSSSGRGTGGGREAASGSGRGGPPNGRARDRYGRLPRRKPIVTATLDPELYAAAKAAIGASGLPNQLLGRRGDPAQAGGGRRAGPVRRVKGAAETRG
jgi:hypothetical protein